MRCSYFSFHVCYDNYSWIYRNWIENPVFLSGAVFPTSIWTGHWIVFFFFLPTSQILHDTINFFFPKSVLFGLLSLSPQESIWLQHKLMQLELLKKPKPKEATTALHCFPLREGSSLEEQPHREVWKECLQQWLSKNGPEGLILCPC